MQISTKIQHKEVGTQKRKGTNSHFFTLNMILMILFSACQPKSPMQRDSELPIHKVFMEHEVLQQQKYPMKLVTAGTPHNKKIDRAALHYILFKKMKIPEARALLIASVEDFLILINNNETTQKLLKNPPLTYQDIKFNIGFGTKKGAFQEPPYLAYAYLDEGIIRYCYRDEIFGNFIEEKDVEESFEEALMILKNQNKNSAN